jgi:hypothetical protein
MCYDPKIVIKELSLSYLSRCAPLRVGICGVSGRIKNIFLFFSKAFLCFSPKIVRKEFSLSYLSKCAPLRAGICGVSGRIKGSAGRNIFFYSSAKLPCALVPKLLEKNKV